MFDRKGLVKIGLLIGIIGLVALFPARIGYRWLAPPQVALNGISGTVWNGSAQEATADGLYLRNLSWRFRPMDLFTGKIGLALDSNFVAGSINGNFAFGFGGSIRATDFRATLPLDAIQSVAALAGARGTLTADFEELRISDGLPVVANGSVEVAGLTLPLVHRDPIGGFRAELFTQDAGISASIEDTAAVIDLAGSLQLTADGKYEFHAQLSPVDSTPTAIREQLRFLGSANDRGQHEIRLEGRL
jgi:general secretion pathway protein N